MESASSPEDATWIRASADSIDPDAQTVTTSDGGRAIFTAPPGPLMGASAPINVMHQTEEFWRTKGFRDGMEVIFATAGSPYYGGSTYNDLIKRDIAEENFTVWPHLELIQIRPANKEAVFRIVDELTGTGDINGVATIKTREYARKQASKVASAIKKDLTEASRMR